MSLTISKKEIGLLYGLLRAVGDEFLEKIPSDHSKNDESENLAKYTRLNKLIASNLKQKMHFELRHNE